jgi:predicted LPLAT superfamily acyltransferase
MTKPCLLIPVYNHEEALTALVEELRPYGLFCVLVDDGSSPESAAVLDALARREAGWMRLFRHPENRGKGAAVVTGVREALALGYTHALQLDADGQHDPKAIPRFLEASAREPDALVCGAPRFDASAPRARRWGRVLTIVWIWINTLSLQIQDGLCGFRVYPLAPTLALFGRVRVGQRMDFDPEVAVRLHWAGLEAISLPVEVRYPLEGKSHFRMAADNGLISWAHTRLFFGMLIRLPWLLARKLRSHDLPERSSPSRSKGRDGHGWSTLQEAGSATGLTLLFWIYRVLGRLPFRVALYPVLVWFFLTRRVARNASLEFLTRARQRPARWRDGLSHFLSFAEAILDKLIAWNDGFRLSDVTFVNREPLAERLSRKEGCLLISSHLGNVEICRVLSRWRPELELHVLVHTRHAQKFNRVVRRLSSKSQLNLHQVTELDAGLAAWMSERLSNGAVIVIAGDRVPVGDGRVSAASFLGASAAFAQGPYLLAHALGCPVQLLFCVRRGKGFQVTFEPFADAVRLPRGEGREAGVQALAQRYAERLAAHAARDPLQWFNFYPYWRKV